MLPVLRIENLGASLKVLYVNNTDLTRDRRFTYLTEDVVATGSTIRVQSIVGFESLTTGSGQIICIGEIGNERTELLRTSNNTAPSSSYKEVTLRDTLAFDHPQDTKVYIVDWNRIEFDYAGTATGTKTTLEAYPINIQADVKEHVYRETNKDGVFYFARFNDSINSRNSSWSDPVFSGEYDDNSVFKIKQRALHSLGQEIDGNLITHEFLNESLWEARREYHNAPGKRPFRRKFNTVLGTALTGSYRIQLPVDVQKPYSADNIYGVRIGTNENMSYYDKKDWDSDWRNKPHSTLEVPYVYNTSTSIWLANGRDFSESATIQVEGQSIGVTRIAGLTGDSYYNSLRIYSHPSGGWNASAGSDAYSNVSFGLPDKFTVWFDPGGSAYIYFNKPIDTAYVNQNIYGDYYTTLVGYNSDADILDEPEYDMYVDYLKSKIKHRKNRGDGDITTDSDYKLWQFKKQSALSTEQLSTDIRIVPDIDHLL